MRLSVVIPCFDSLGAAATFHSLVMCDEPLHGSIDITVVGSRERHLWLANYVDEFNGCEFQDYTRRSSRAGLVNAAMAAAKHDYVLCLQPSAILKSGVITKLLDFYNGNPNSTDLYQGPLVIGDRFVVLEKPWDPWDTGLDVKDKVDRDRCFRIEAQDLAAFACKKSAWPGASDLFRAFDGCGYIHDKFREAGSHCFCMSWFKWVRPPVIPGYNTDDLLYDFSLWYTEVGKDPRPMLEPFNIEFADAVDKFKSVGAEWKLAPSKLHAPLAAKLVSCVVITDAYTPDIMECLESYGRQTYPFLEMIIINQGPNEFDVDAPGTKVINSPNFALRDILRIVNGNLILLWSKDMSAKPSMVSLMVGGLKDGFSQAGPSILIDRAILDSTSATDVDGLIREFDAEPKIDIGPVGVSCEVPHKIYLFLMMWNLLEWPRKIIDDMSALDRFEVVLVDQGSSYEPLLLFYKSYPGLIRRLPVPIGRFDFLQSPIIGEFCKKGELFAVCDPDVDVSQLPAHTADILVQAMCESGTYAAGIEREGYTSLRFWDKPGGGARFPFTLYKNNAGFRGVPQRGVDLPIRHMPDTLDVASGLSDELAFYLEKRFEHSKAGNRSILDAYYKLVDKSRDD